MKLRNRKTGKVFSVRSSIGGLDPPNIVLVINNKNREARRVVYNSLAELNEEWEDYRVDNETL